METLFLSIVGLIAALALFSQLVKSAQGNTCPGQTGNFTAASGQAVLPPQCAHCQRCRVAEALAMSTNNPMSATGRRPTGERLKP
ncbi:MAG: hypothetical protein M1299_05240 [Firmicutes bacterium]|nr:hypothetical protein [Bacillota bacterium]MCL5039217.1 hypothetical protein [Bacillota bacterium]